MHFFLNHTKVLPLFCYIKIQLTIYILLIKSTKLNMFTPFVWHMSMNIVACLFTVNVWEGPIIKAIIHKIRYHNSHMSESPCLHVFLHVLPVTTSSAGAVGTCLHPSPPSRQPQRSLRLSFSASISSFLKSKVATSMLAELPILPSLLCRPPMTDWQVEGMVTQAALGTFALWL